MASTYIVLTLDFLQGTLALVVLVIPYVVLTMLFLFYFPNLQDLTLTFMAVLSFSLTIVELLKRRVTDEGSF